MQSADETVETLTTLGLTMLQAKVYITLTKLSNATGRATAREAKVAPQDVYRVLTELQEKSLVEKIIAKPNKYHAMPLGKGLSMLLQRRKKETKQLEKSVNVISLRSNFTMRDTETAETGNFAIISKEEPLRSKVQGFLETAQSSIDLMNEFHEGLNGHDDLFKLEVNLLNRGVKIRDVLSKSTSSFHMTKTFTALLKKQPLFQVRYLNFPAPAKLVIKDNKEVLISTMNKPETLLQPFLWSDNPVLVKVISQWYNNMWEKGCEENYLLQVPRRQVK